MKFIKDGNIITIILPEKQSNSDDICSMCGIECNGVSFDTKIELNIFDDNTHRYYGKDAIASLIASTILGDNYKLCKVCLSSVRAAANSNQSTDILDSYVKPKMNMEIKECHEYSYYEGSIDIKEVDIPIDVIESLAIKYLSAKAIRTIKKDKSKS